MKRIFSLASSLALFLVLADGAAHERAGAGVADDPKEEAEFKVTFRSDPPGAQVEIDTKQRCKTRCTLSLKKGAYVIGMTMPGYEWKEELIEVDSNRTIKWKLPLILGTLSLTSEPEGLKYRVTRAGRSRGKEYSTPLEGLALEPGTYVVELLDLSYLPEKKLVKVESGKPTALELEPVGRNGELNITVLDEYGDRTTADVRVNGRRLKGSGPWPLKPGKHNLEIRYEGRVLFKQKVEMQPDGVVELVVQNQVTEE